MMDTLRPSNAMTEVYAVSVQLTGNTDLCQVVRLQRRLVLGWALRRCMGRWRVRWLFCSLRRQQAPGSLRCGVPQMALAVCMLQLQVCTLPAFA